MSMNVIGMSPTRFCVMALGGAAAIVAFNTYVGPNLPPAAFQWNLMGISGMTAWFAASALIGGYFASKAFTKVA